MVQALSPIRCTHAASRSSNQSGGLSSRCPGALSGVFRGPPSTSPPRPGSFIAQILVDENAGKLRPRRHAQLAENFDQVVLDRAGADEELRGNLLVAGAIPYEARNLPLLRGELILRFKCPLAGSFTGRQELDARTVGKGPDAPRRGHLMCRPALFAGVPSPTLPPQPFSE